MQRKKNNDFVQQLISHAMGFVMTTESQDLGLTCVCVCVCVCVWPVILKQMILETVIFSESQT